MEVSGQSQRWQGQRSAFSWEQSALDHIKGQLPDAEPYRAWQTMTFTTDRGHVREVDLFIATPGGLFLVEIKSHPGTATNHGSTWLFRDSDKTRTIENPLHFTDQKTKELKSQLERAARKLKLKDPLPRIEAAVFLSAENLKSHLDEFQCQRVYGRDGLSTGLPGIWKDFLNQPPTSERNRVTPTLSKQLPKLLQEIGIARLHRLGRVGPYELSEKSFDSGPTWEDYLATNPSLPNDYPRRVRVFLSERTATEADKKSVQRAAHREYLALQGISHDGIVRAEQYSDELLAGPAVVFRHGANWQRLDLYLAGNPDLELDTRLHMVRQLAEALDHAHRRHLYHRALAPRSVYVELDGRYPRLRIADWQVAARPGSTTGGATGTRATSTQLPGGAAALMAHIERSAGAYLAPEFDVPESPALLDVFGLGALSYLILTGRPPAATRGELATRLSQTRALLPSALIDSVSPAMDALVRDATQLSVADRTESVRSFLRSLDAIEEELTAPDPDPQQDPLATGPGDEIAGWTVLRQLGTGSTSKALLVQQDGSPDRVFKVSLNESAARRLDREADQLAPLIDSHVARLLDRPFQAGPDGATRTVIGVEYVGDHTLAEELRQHGPLTIHELERLGEDLFQAMAFLDRRAVWHRDIKPDNLALRELDRKGRELVLFDFSLAGTPDSDLIAGTRGYQDPFLGTPSRQRYDQAAELYAVAVTLHEMASGELPSWGDDLADARFLDPTEEVQLAEDLFDPVARDGLVEFFKVTFQRDAAKRFASLHDMTRAWTDIFRDLDTVPPLTTAATNPGADEEEGDTADPVESARAKRAEAAAQAAPSTPLAAAGLSPFALSIAQQRLGIDTAGDLARVPAKRITALRGIGSVPRYELVRLSREWRQRFNLAESALSRADMQWAEGERPQSVRTDQNHSAERVGPSAAGQSSLEAPEDLAQLSVDEIVRRLVPDAPGLPQVTGLAQAANGRQASPWAAPLEIARVTGLAEPEVTAHLDRLRNRWQKSVKALTPVRDDLIEILRAHGRVLGWRQLAAGLLAKRGAEISDPVERLRLAAICVRAAVETEERRENARMASRRWPVPVDVGPDAAAVSAALDARVIVALTDEGEEGTAPPADELFIYAELLGFEADALAAKDPLPGVTEIRQVLREVPTATHAQRLSDTDLVLLAAAASEKSAATPRLELYPRDLPPTRAVKISQVGSIAEGALAEELARRVLGRFPDLYEANRPTAETMPELLESIGYSVTRGSDSRLNLWPSTGVSSGSRSRTFARITPSTATAEAAEHALARLTQARQRGGFIALKTHLRDAAAIRAELAALDGVTPVKVTTEFVRTLRAVVAEQGRPKWETVLAADSPEASPPARNGFTQLLTKTWTRLEEHIRAAGSSGIALLHDATPLARYSGGVELLARLAVAARDAAESPVGLWLLCPMEDPQGAPLLDRVTVSVLPGDAEQLYVPAEFGSAGQDPNSGKDLKAS